MPGSEEDTTTTSQAEALAPRPAPPPGLTLAAAAAAPFRYPRLTTTLVLWALGLFLAFLARPPAITPEATATFMAKFKQAEALLPELTAAERRLMNAELDQRQYKARCWMGKPELGLVWFWRHKPDARREVEARQGAVDAARAQAVQVEARKDQLLKEAKAALGLWSEAGVTEGRQLFWDSFASGRLFARRQSFWDSLWIILGSRERDWLSMLLSLMFQTIINFITGVALACFVFLCRLPWMIWSYGPALWSGAAFFVLCAVAAISVVASYIGLLVGAGATATLTTLSLVAAQRERLEGGGAGRRRIAYPHQD